MHWILTPEQAEGYVRRGLVQPEQSPSEWSQAFRRIGGGSCTVRPYVAGSLIVQATGNARAIAYVEATIRSLEPQVTR